MNKLNNIYSFKIEDNLLELIIDYKLYQLKLSFIVELEFQIIQDIFSKNISKYNFEIKL